MHVIWAPCPREVRRTEVSVAGCLGFTLAKRRHSPSEVGVCTRRDVGRRERLSCPTTWKLSSSTSTVIQELGWLSPRLWLWLYLPPFWHQSSLGACLSSRRGEGLFCLQEIAIWNSIPWKLPSPQPVYFSYSTCNYCLTLCLIFM